MKTIQPCKQFSRDESVTHAVDRVEANVHRTGQSKSSRKTGEQLLGREPGRRTQTLLVPIDFTPASVKALDHALVVARQSHASIMLLHVVNGVYTGPFVNLRTKALIQQNERDRANQQLKLLAESVMDPPVAIECMVRSGLPAHEIVRAAEGLKADMIILGQRTRNPLLRLLFGTVISDVVDTAPCPVLVVTGNASPLN